MSAKSNRRMLDTAYGHETLKETVFQFGIKNTHLLVGTSRENHMKYGGVDGTRTRDPRRDRPVF